ncbi:predicted protein [Phaeodactylum tricornutum CCAP 1055/1]|jgi:hypothetical protein|uniref:Late endosomal/lysosomal adaptor and MAPK and MTOR activator 5 n=2 Tax=Phaeodactylum tricornutum TaxID=2850 RepID=B7FSU5_PHATC|nr:predicted protein [Phaeodactylum tricornutum CCAP 1055/1]EEC50855.1 predicted protein [Phaeodactylum tricornutum CCAP 1055/1]|eukprot:XP_002178041.1 predicted protein [Phaeodactylum tricornutum CCAP 1055/1]
MSAPSASNGRQSGRSQSESLIHSMVSGDRAHVGGLLCNDPAGLCLATRGNMGNEDSGTYTNLVRLASQLQPDSKESSSDGAIYAAPLITIETESSAILVKEYDGHAVAIRVPKAEACVKDGATSMDSEASS